MGPSLVPAFVQPAGIYPQLPPASDGSVRKNVSLACGPGPVCRLTAPRPHALPHLSSSGRIQTRGNIREPEVTESWVHVTVAHMPGARPLGVKFRIAAPASAKAAATRHLDRLPHRSAHRSPRRLYHDVWAHSPPAQPVREIMSWVSRGRPSVIPPRRQIGQRRGKTTGPRSWRSPPSPSSSV